MVCTQAVSHCPWKMKRVLLRLGARRVATRLASLGFFHFRRVLQENPNTVSSLSHLSRAPPFPLRTQWSSARPCTHRKKNNAAEGRTSGRPVRRKKKEKKRKKSSTTTLGREGVTNFSGGERVQNRMVENANGPSLKPACSDTRSVFPQRVQWTWATAAPRLSPQKQKFINKSSSKSNFFHNQIESSGQNQTRWHARNNPCFCESVPSKHGSGA